MNNHIEKNNADIEKNLKLETANRFIFGVDSKFPANDLLQNNLNLFEWVTRNKVYPIFWGRNITGENALTKDEMFFLQDKRCRIAITCNTADQKETQEQGKCFAKEVIHIASELGIPKDTAIFIEIDEKEIATTSYMLGFVREVLDKGYTPGFKANTDAKFTFDREFCIGMKYERLLFEKSLIWAKAPLLDEYNGIITSHLIYPERWKPFAPSCISRDVISIWQYGQDCHPIYDDSDNNVVFNINIIKNCQLIEKMV